MDRKEEGWTRIRLRYSRRLSRDGDGDRLRERKGRKNEDGRKRPFLVLRTSPLHAYVLGQFRRSSASDRYCYLPSTPQEDLSSLIPHPLQKQYY